MLHFNIIEALGSQTISDPFEFKQLTQWPLGHKQNKMCYVQENPPQASQLMQIYLYQCLLTIICLLALCDVTTGADTFQLSLPGYWQPLH